MGGEGGRGSGRYVERAGYHGIPRRCLAGRILASFRTGQSGKGQKGGLGRQKGLDLRPSEASSASSNRPGRSQVMFRIADSRVDAEERLDRRRDSYARMREVMFGALGGGWRISVHRDGEVPLESIAGGWAHAGFPAQVFGSLCFCTPLTKPSSNLHHGQEDDRKRGQASPAQARSILDPRHLRFLVKTSIRSAGFHLFDHEGQVKRPATTTPHDR